MSRNDYLPDVLPGMPTGPENAEPEPAEPVSKRRSPGGSPSRAEDALTEIRDGCFGLLMNTDRIVEFHEDGYAVRHSSDEDVVTSLINQGYAVQCGDRKMVRCRHGAVTRSVVPIRLTPDGRQLVARWSKYKPI